MDYQQAITLLVASTSFSLFSMFHCAVMCGPLKSSLVKGSSNTFIYHLGRLVSYSFIACFIHFFAVSPYVKLVKEYDHIFMIFLSVSIAISIILFIVKNYQSRSKLITRKLIYFSLKWENKKIKALLCGITTGLLPCGVLYAFLISLSMQEHIEWILACVLVYVFITSIGVELSATFIELLKRKLSIKKQYIVFPMYLLSLFMVLYRFFYAEFNGVCFS